MKLNTVLFLLCAAVTGSAQTASVLDLLRSIQPGAPASSAAPAQPAQPAPAAAAPPAAVPPPALDTKPVFTSIVTNYVKVTNAVIVTNYVVVTNLTFSTNFYNAQGQLLTPISGAMPALTVVESRPAAPPPPDPAVIRSNRLQAVRDLLTLSATATSNTLAVSGSFAANPERQIRIPEGVTVLDRKKGQALTTALNNAAERAVPETMALVQKSIAQLNPADPAQVLQGGTDSATRFLLSAEGQNLANQVLAIVQSTALQANVQQAYNAVMLRGGGLLGAVLGTGSSVDMNAHITRGLMEAIFLKLTAQENLIRTDPSLRKTKALQAAFGT